MCSIVSLMSQRILSWNDVAWLNFLIGVARVLCNCTLPIATFPSRICPRCKLDARAWKWKPWVQIWCIRTYRICETVLPNCNRRLYRFDRISRVKKITVSQCTRPYFFLICFFAREKYFSFTSQEMHFKNRFWKVFFTQIHPYVIFSLVKVKGFKTLMRNSNHFWMNRGFWI